MKLFPVFLGLILSSTLVRAQTAFTFAPWEASSDAYHVDDLALTDLFFQYQRVVPIPSLLPQTTADSRMDILRIGAGSRFIDGSHERFLFRATALDLMIQRAIWTGAFTLLDYDRSRLENLDADWISLSAGPGFNIRNESFSAVARLLFTGGVSSWKFGNDIFPFLTAEQDTGIEYAVQIHGDIRLGKHLHMRLHAEVSQLTDSQFLKRELLFETGYQFSEHFSGALILNRVEFEIQNSTNEYDGIKVSLQFSPGHESY